MDKIKKENKELFIDDFGRDTHYDPHPNRRNNSSYNSPSQRRPVRTIIYEIPKKSKEEIIDESIEKLLDDYYEVIIKSMDINEIKRANNIIQQLLSQLSDSTKKIIRQRRLERLFETRITEIISIVGKVIDVYKIEKYYEFAMSIIDSFPNYPLNKYKFQLSEKINSRIKDIISKIESITSFEELDKIYDEVMYLLSYLSEAESSVWHEKLNEAFKSEHLENLAVENINDKIKQISEASNFSEVKSLYNEGKGFMKYLPTDLASNLCSKIDGIINTKLHVSISPLIELVKRNIENIEIRPALNLADYDDITLSDYENIIYADFCKEFADSNKKFSIPKHWKQFSSTYLTEILPYDSQEIEHKSVEEIIRIHQIWNSLSALVPNIQDGEGKQEYFEIKRMMMDFVIKIMNKNILVLNMSDRSILCQEAISQCDSLIEEFISDIPEFLLMVYKYKKSVLYKKWNDYDILTIIHNHKS